MESISRYQYSTATVLDALPAAELFRIGKEIDQAFAHQLFKEEFSICDERPEDRTYFLARSNDFLVGYAGARSYDQNRDENMYETTELLPSGWYLRGLKVHPAHRRTGIARELTKRRLQWLQARSKSAFVFLNDEKKETLPMYQEFGFQIISKGWEFLNQEHKRQDQRGVLLSLHF